MRCTTDYGRGRTGQITEPLVGGERQIVPFFARHTPFLGCIASALSEVISVITKYSVIIGRRRGRTRRDEVTQLKSTVFINITLTDLRIRDSH